MKSTAQFIIYLENVCNIIYTYKFGTYELSQFL